MYIINGPAFPEEVKEFTGFNYNNVIQDDNMLYLFATKNGIIEEYVSSCKYRMILKGVNNGFTKYTSSNIVKIRNRIDEGIQHYKLVSVE
ncbi:MAG: hypothetical protein EOO90_23125 [Pedobacter sp.]|nr:MAG: hypothetical protein EOO90_23125 [Pedobacter sp.]